LKYFTRVADYSRHSTPKKYKNVKKTKDGAIEALCKAGNFYDFEK